MATMVRSDAKVLRHDNHTAPVALTLRSFTKPANALLIYNAGATQAEVSFDGTNSFPIPAGSTFSVECDQLTGYYTSGNVAVKVLYGSQE